MEENKKLNPFVRIRGNAQRGEEVIEELERRGGNNFYAHDGKREDQWYYLTSDGIVMSKYEPEPTTFFCRNYEEIKLPRWRAEKGGEYYYVFISESGYCRINVGDENGRCFANTHYATGNYYSTKAEAQEKADAINALLRGGDKL